MTTSHPGQPGMRVPGAGETDAAGAGVPAIPQRFREWGWVFLGFVFLVLSALIADVGRAHGKGVGWVRHGPPSGWGCSRCRAWRPWTP